MGTIENLKRARLKNIQGQETHQQVAYLPQAGAILPYEECLIPGVVVSANISSAPYLVGIGSVLRIQVTSDTYLAFGNPDDGVFGTVAITSATSPGLKLVGATGRDGVYHVVATDDFVYASANPVRVEVISMLPSQG